MNVEEFIIGNWEVNIETGEVRNRYTKEILE